LRARSKIRLPSPSLGWVPARTEIINQVINRYKSPPTRAGAFSLRPCATFVHGIRIAPILKISWYDNDSPRRGSRPRRLVPQQSMSVIVVDKEERQLNRSLRNFLFCLQSGISFCAIFNTSSANLNFKDIVDIL